jgi:Flp pilus assembly protein TadG
MRFRSNGAWHDDRGVAAVEFAMVAPLFILLAVGTFYLCMCLFVTGSLHYAVEQAARCASVQYAACTGSNTVVSYAQSSYFGPGGGTPNFTYNAAAACGKQVNATLNYVWSTGFHQFTLPVSATACFP